MSFVRLNLAGVAAGDELALQELDFSGLGLVAVLLFAFVLFGVLGGLRWLLGLLPMSKARRTALSRFRPVLEVLVAVVYLLLAVPIVFKGHGEFTPLVLAVLLIGLVGVSWSAIRDVVNGMFIKAGELCEVGDHVVVDDQAGVVKQLGSRVLTLETDDGAELFIPYGRLSRRSILRTRRTQGVHRHTFDLQLPPDVEPLGAAARVKQLAMSSHWSSIVREPEIESLVGGMLQVQVFALGREHGAAIEAQVRRGLQTLES